MKQLKTNEVAEWETVALQLDKEEIKQVMIGLVLTMLIFPEDRKRVDKMLLVLAEIYRAAFLDHKT